MNFNAHDNLILVAPRPVRLAAPTPYTHFPNAVLQRPQARSSVRLVSGPVDALDRLKLADDSPDQDAKPDPAPPSDRDSVSPRASPRCVFLPFATLMCPMQAFSSLDSPLSSEPLVRLIRAMLIYFVVAALGSLPKHWKSFSLFYAPRLL